MISPTEELKFLRDFLRRFESNELRLVRNHVDVSQREMGVLRREIAFLEKILARSTE